MNVCVFCSSSGFINRSYFEAAKALGKLIGDRGHNLIFGGTDLGLMGALAQSAKSAGAKVTGVIPRLIYERGISFTKADSMIVTADLRERKATMERMADGFIALPGGFGTLEEAFEIITIKQLQMHQKPVVFINTEGFYNPLMLFIEQMAGERFIHNRYQDLFQLADSPETAIQYLTEYTPVQLAEKWTG